MTKSNKPPLPPAYGWLVDDPPRKPAADVTTAVVLERDQAREESRKRDPAELGRKSGESRQREAEEGWKAHALTLAVTIRKESSRIPQTKLAVEIKKRWKLHIHCPESMLVREISKWEHEGKLPRHSK